MTPALAVNRIGPSVTVQDLGRPGYLAFGLSQGGAADRRALAEGAALLRQPISLACLELAGFGGTFTALAGMRIALTGAPMSATLDGRTLQWNASHRISAGQSLAIGGAQAGVYGYLHLAGGLAGTAFLGSLSAHLAGGIWRGIAEGDTMHIGQDPHPDAVDSILDCTDRLTGGTIRLLPGIHTDLFSAEIRARFEATVFTTTRRSNRQAAELAFDGAPFASSAQLSVLSEPMIPGDVQMTGAGMPYVLLPECQTTGGYPRIGTVHPDDLPIVAQAAPGIALRFRFVSHQQAMADYVPLADYATGLQSRVRPLIRDPRDIADLLSYQLTDGAITGWDET